MTMPHQVGDVIGEYVAFANHPDYELEKGDVVTLFDATPEGATESWKENRIMISGWRGHMMGAVIRMDHHPMVWKRPRKRVYKPSIFAEPSPIP